MYEKKLVQLLVSPPCEPVMKRLKKLHEFEDSDESEGTIVCYAARWQLHIY